VRLENGEISCDEEQRQSRWQGHFAGVVVGTIANDVDLLVTKPPTKPQFIDGVDLYPQRVQTAIARLGRCRGVGKEEIPAELLQCGSAAMAVKLSHLYKRVSDNMQWPTAWKGGREAELFKGKGDSLARDASRGLLIADHMGKGLASIFKTECDGPYSSNIPECQHGALQGKGTDLSHHCILSCIDLAASLSLSIFVLFVDLATA